MSEKSTYRVLAGLLILLGVALSYFVYASEMSETGWLSKFSFQLGLDLSGGSHLVYTANLEVLSEGERSDALSSLRDVIERRVNLFGVSEAVVQTERDATGKGRLIVELPGVTDLKEAVALIGATPFLEFKTENPKIDRATISFDEVSGETRDKNGNLVSLDDLYLSSGLSGKHIQKAQLAFNQVNGEPYVSLIFNDEGSDLFQKITRENIGKTVAIYLDGVPVSNPVVQEEISGGQAQISGQFTIDEARTLVGRLNAGALPIPIELLSTETIGATLGEVAIRAGIYAGMVAGCLIAFFMIFWYRLPGLIAIIGLLFYVIVVFSIFKLIPVTLTAAGIAGFILSLGIAVDANVLIFSRLTEERKTGKNPDDALRAAFSRAWTSIRDSNVTSIFIAIILFWFGTSLVKGFALTLGIGVLVSMLSAIVFTRALLLSLSFRAWSPTVTFFLGSGLTKNK